MKNKHSPLSFALGFSCASLLPLHAAVVVSTGFEGASYPVGANLQKTDTPLAGDNAAGVQIADQATATPFGATNQFLVLNGTTAAFSAKSTGLTALTTIHFDIYEPNTLTGAKSLDFGLAQNDLNNSTTGAYTAFRIIDGVISLGQNTAKDSGIFPTLVVERAYKAFVLYNGSAVTEMATTPSGGSVSITAGQSGLFFYDLTNGSFIDAGRYSTTASAVPANFQFRAFSGSKNEIYIDNFTREDTLSFAAVPEPSAALLGALGVLGLLRRRR